MVLRPLFCGLGFSFMLFGMAPMAAQAEPLILQTSRVQLSIQDDGDIQISTPDISDLNLGQSFESRLDSDWIRSRFSTLASRQYCSPNQQQMQQSHRVYQSDRDVVYSESYSTSRICR